MLLQNLVKLDLCLLSGTMLREREGNGEEGKGEGRTQLARGGEHEDSDKTRDQQGGRESQDLNTYEVNREQLDTTRAAQVISGRHKEQSFKIKRCHDFAFCFVLFC